MFTSRLVAPGSLHLARIATYGVASWLVLVAGCASPEAATADGAGSEEAQSAASSNDLLAACPALEGANVSAVVVGDATTYVKQSYVVADYSGRNEPTTRVTVAAIPSTLYDVRFYRDAAGKSKFQLSIATWAGMQSSIEGDAKRLVASGTATLLSGDRERGVLTITSRRDALGSVVGDLSTLKFSRLDCTADSPSVIVDVPIVTLQKADDRTVPITDARGNTFQVTPLVRWKKTADSAPLLFVTFAG